MTDPQGMYCETCARDRRSDPACSACSHNARHNYVALEHAPAGRKDDADKPRLDLLPFAAFDPIARVLAHGAKRYGDENWRLVEGAPRRYFAAALRHLTAWGRGEELDPDSGESHLAHAACSLMFLLALKAKPPAASAEDPR